MVHHEDVSQNEKSELTGKHCSGALSNLLTIVGENENLKHNEQLLRQIFNYLCTVLSSVSPLSPVYHSLSSLSEASL